MPKLPSVQTFRKHVLGDPILSMQFQGAIDQIPEFSPSYDRVGEMRPSVLYKSSVESVLDLLNAAAQTPPCFSPTEFCGVPINSLFIDLMNTELGKAMFARSDINGFLKNILNDYGQMLKTEKSLQYLNSGDNGWLSK